MGKTLPPFSQLIEYERRRWIPFKRALPKADQALFDRLFDCAKLHIQAGVVVVKYVGDTFLDLSYEKQPGHPHKTCSPVPPEGPQRKCLSAGRVESIAV
jgi:hypothetical protein